MLCWSTREQEQQGNNALQLKTVICEGANKTLRVENIPPPFVCLSVWYVKGEQRISLALSPVSRENS